MKTDVTFCKKRITEQEEYIAKIRNNTDLTEERKQLIIQSATGQLEYFKTKLNNITNQETINFVGNIVQKKQRYE